MKLLRTLVTALAAVIVAGTVASAAPHLRATFDAEPTPEVTVSPQTSPEPTDPPETEPTEAPTPPPSASETSPPESDEVNEGASTAPDFSACGGLTGLDNAICRHVALLLVKPGHEGLKNALDHLRANQAQHAEDPAEGDGDDPATETDPSTSCPGKSCEAHGNGNGNGHSNH